MDEKETPIGPKILSMDFPSNSHKVPSPGKAEKQEIKKIISGEVTIQKKSLSKRMFEGFFGDDIKSIGSYVMHDVLIPALKSTISEIVTGGTNMALFGESKGSRVVREKGKSFVSYNKMSPSIETRRDISPQDRARHSFGDIKLDTKEEAEDVLSFLVDLVIDEGEATVSDLYHAVGIAGEFTDEKWGWINLTGAYADKEKFGPKYILHLPKTIALD